MRQYSVQTIFNSFIYGGASALLAIDLFFMVKAVFQQNFVPILPVVVGILLSGGLVLILYGERQSRVIDRSEFRRLTRVAHQLEHPLRTLQDDFSYLMKHADHLPAEERMKLKRMDTKTRVLLENIRDVFLTLRAAYGSVTQEKRVYDLCVAVHEVVEKMRPLATSRNVEIVERAHCPEAKVTMDKSMFQVALIHLIENAIVYNRTPGIVNVSITRGKQSTRVVVQDKGIGVSDEDAPAILKPFARGHRAEQYDPDGIGVGLALVNSIMKEHEGQLNWRKRTKGLGTEFELVMPLANAEKA